VTTHALSDVERGIRERARRFVDQELIPWEVHTEEHGGHIPEDVREGHRRKAVELGLFAMTYRKSSASSRPLASRVGLLSDESLRDGGRSANRMDASCQVRTVVTVFVSEETFPAASEAVAVSTNVLAAPGAVQEQVHSGAVSVHFTAPFTAKTTLVTPTSSAANTVIVTLVPRARAVPSRGLVISTLGATSSGAGAGSGWDDSAVTEAGCGEALAS
jgi:hypothetical protein